VINIGFIFLFSLHSSSKWEGVVYRLIQLGRRRGMLDMDLLRGRLLGLLSRDLLSVFISVLVDSCWCGSGGVALLLDGGSEERRGKCMGHCWYYIRRLDVAGQRVGVACIVSVVGLSCYDVNVIVSAQIVGNSLGSCSQVWFHCQLCRAWFGSWGRAFENWGVPPVGSISYLATA
jgi:hypothetical protein